MRQAGVLAAAGLYALDHNRARLSDDHDRAQTLAEELRAIAGFDVDIESVRTNMVYVSTESPASEVAAWLGGVGIDVLDLGSSLLRLVTHLHITDEDIFKTVHAFKNFSS